MRRERRLKSKQTQKTLQQRLEEEEAARILSKELELQRQWEQSQKQQAGAHSVPPLQYQCHWSECRERFFLWESLMYHLLSDHIKTQRKSKKSKPGFACCWEDCTLSHDSDRRFHGQREILTHIRCHHSPPPLNTPPSNFFFLKKRRSKSDKGEKKQQSDSESESDHDINRTSSPSVESPIFSHLHFFSSPSPSPSPSASPSPSPSISCSPSSISLYSAMRSLDKMKISELVNPEENPYDEMNRLYHNRVVQSPIQSPGMGRHSTNSPALSSSPSHRSLTASPSLGGYGILRSNSPALSSSPSSEYPHNRLPRLWSPENMYYQPRPVRPSSIQANHLEVPSLSSWMNHSFPTPGALSSPSPSLSSSTNFSPTGPLSPSTPHASPSPSIMTRRTSSPLSFPPLSPALSSPTNSGLFMQSPLNPHTPPSTHLYTPPSSHLSPPLSHLSPPSSHLSPPSSHLSPPSLHHTPPSIHHTPPSIHHTPPSIHAHVRSSAISAPIPQSSSDSIHNLLSAAKLLDDHT